jgi:hypothetical protein
MIEDQKDILEWLIEDIDFSNPKALFDNEHSKEFISSLNVTALIKLSTIDYVGRSLLRTEGLTVYFYPLAIENYLKDNI